MLSNNFPRKRERSAKKKWCRRCQSRTDFVFDHGHEMFICQSCEM